HSLGKEQPEGQLPESNDPNQDHERTSPLPADQESRSQHHQRVDGDAASPGMVTQEGLPPSESNPLGRCRPGPARPGGTNPPGLRADSADRQSPPGARGFPPWM